MHGPFAFCYDCQPSSGEIGFLILVAITFQFFKACYSFQKYTCVNKHTLFDNGAKM